jgi:hypothetical protein
MASFNLYLPLTTTVAIVSAVSDELHFGSLIEIKEVTTKVCKVTQRFIFTVESFFPLTSDDINRVKDLINEKTNASLEAT